MIVPSSPTPATPDRPATATSAGGTRPGAGPAAGPGAGSGAGLGASRAGGGTHAPATAASVGGAGTLPVLGPGQTLEASVIRPANASTATGPASLAIRIVALAAPPAASGAGTLPDGALATLVAIGADGRPVIATGDALLRLDATTDLEPGTSLIVDSSLRPAGRTSVDAATLASAGGRQPAEAATATAGPFDVLAALCSAVWQACKAGGKGHEAPPAARQPSVRVPSISPTTRDPAQPGGVAATMEPLPVPASGPASLRLFIDEDRADASAMGRDGPGKGFVLAIRLSRLGLVELDARLDPGAKRCDITVRSEVPLPAAAHADLRTVFAAAGEVVGLRGVLGFARTPARPPATTGD